jgi:hypothetical protein
VLTKVILFFGLLIGITVAIRQSIHNRSLLYYLDAHPNPSIVPAAEYYVGQTLYIFRDLEEASTYFIRVPQRYPQSPYADDASYAYIQCQDDQPAVVRSLLIDEYQKYLEQFPDGKHAEIVRNRVDTYKSGAR